jgi:ATP-dependent 26S proteasome regulatory subunit
LELANRKSKLVIGCANLLSDFHSAVIRPQRFDEIILVDTLDPETINGVLGGLTVKYGEKVAHWPIAYVNELKKKSLVVDEKELEKSFIDLNKRVERQLISIGKKAKGAAEEEDAPALVGDDDDSDGMDIKVE